ncbi:MAG: mechanosensitive ion channel family protein [Anaerolineae bacterium]|nr:mechanosensitive ion channel family protein [Anaerolineae bacterium]
MENLDQVTQELLLLVVQFIPKLIVALLTFGAALLLARPAAKAVHRGLSRRVETQGLPRLMARITRWGVIIGGTIVALEQVNFNVTGFLAGLGVAGLTIGFALQDITRNFVSGVLLMLRQPFAVNDYVNAGGFSGTVLDINTRDTTIKADNGELVIIPNIKVYENPITNFSRSSNRQRVVTLNLQNEGDIEARLDQLRSTIQNVPGILADPEPTVWAERSWHSTVAVTVRFWIDTRVANLLEVHSAAVLALNRAAKTVPPSATVP